MTIANPKLRTISSSIKQFSNSSIRPTSNSEPQTTQQFINSASSLRILVTTSILGTLLIAAAWNRGFDWSDEGFYLLLADPNQANSSGLLGYDLFFKFIGKELGWKFSIIHLRILRWLSVVFAAWLLAKWMTRNWPSQSGQTHFFLISYVGLLASYSFLPPTLSYNSLTLCLACCWLFLNNLPGTKLNLSLLTGTILGVLVYVKLPTAIILFGLSWIGILRSSTTDFTKASHTLMLIFPLMGMELLLWSTLQDSFFLRLGQAISVIQSRPDYAWPTLLKINLVGWMWIFVTAIPWFIVGKLSPKGKVKFNLSFPLSIFCFLAVAWITHITEEWNHLLILAAASYLGFLLGKENYSTLRSHNLALLLILPFALHLGSNVYFLRISVLFIVFWVLAASVIWHPPSEKVNIIVHGVLGISILVLVFVGVWQAPFGHTQPLWKSRTQYTIPGNSSLYLDSALVKTLHELQVKTLQSPSILAAYRNPGIPFLLGKTIPYFPGFWDSSQLEATPVASQQPQLIIFSPHDPLPSGWHFRDTLGIWPLGDQSIYLLSR